MIVCDEKLGVCSVKEVDLKDELELEQPTLFYIGDPMCSWCYGMSDILKDTQEYCAKNGIKFQTIVAGLRTSGQVLWDKRFKGFLKEEWTNISNRTGKKFSFEILDLLNFDYDTTPACKAVLISKILSFNNSKIVLEFFSKIQEKFYANSQDTKKLEFYKLICEDLNLDFEEFSKLFEDKSLDKKLQNEFIFGRNLSSFFPSLILVNKKQKVNISIGYSSLEEVISRINKNLKSF
ncbi:MAG: DsbA family protein [Aliarcobacter sp.]